MNSKAAAQLYDRNLYYRRKSVVDKVARILEDVRTAVMKRCSSTRPVSIM